jgi:hypothetical protein
VKRKLVEGGGWREQVSTWLSGDVLGWDQMITGAGSLAIFRLKNYQRHDYQKTMKL